MKNRIQAFTILELMVVSVLTAILVSAAILAFQLIDQQFRNYYKQTSVSLNYSSLHSLLKEDIDRAYQLKTAEDQRLTLLLPDYEIQYQFESEQIIRQALLPEVRGDTFALQLKQMSYAFRGQTQLYGPVDYLHFEIEEGPFTYPFTFHKHYSASDLILLHHGD